MTWAYWAAFSAAAALLVVAAVLAWDERRRERKRADRATHVRFMRPIWGTKWEEVYPSPLGVNEVVAILTPDGQRRDAALGRVARDVDSAVLGARSER